MGALSTKDTDTKDILSSEEVSVNESSNSFLLFSYTLGCEEENVRARRRFVDTFRSMPDAFSQESYVLFQFLSQTGLILPKLSERGLRDFLTLHSVRFQNDAQIDLADFESEGSDSYMEFAHSVIKCFNLCQAKTADITEAVFSQALVSFKEEFARDFLSKAYSISNTILTDGVKVKGNLLLGADASLQFMDNAKRRLNNFKQQTSYRGVVVYGVNDADSDTGKSVQRICSIGDIAALNAVNAYLYAGDMFNLTAGAKMGKSRMMTQLGVVAVEHGVNVAFWSPENGFLRTEYMFRACQFYRDFFRAKHLPVGKFSDKALFTRDETAVKKEILELEESVWAAYKNSSGKKYRASKTYKEKDHAATLNDSGSDRGLFINVEADFTVDNFLNVIEDASNRYGIGLWIIDYFGLIGDSGHKKTTTNERIADIYKNTKRFLNGKPYAMASPAQMKQEKVDLLAGMTIDKIAAMDLQTITGLSYEIFKTSDLNLFFWSSIADKEQHKANLLYMESRNLERFSPIVLNTNLGVSYFQS